MKCGQLEEVPDRGCKSQAVGVADAGNLAGEGIEVGGQSLDHERDLLPGPLHVEVAGEAAQHLPRAFTEGPGHAVTSISRTVLAQTRSSTDTGTPGLSARKIWFCRTPASTYSLVNSSWSTW